MGIGVTATIVAVEPIRRVAVDVSPRARSGFSGARQRQTQQTTEPRLVVLVLIERLLPSAANGRKRPSRRHRKAKTAAPIAREVPRLDLLEGPFLRIWAFYEAVADRSVGRERRATELVRARLARPERAFRCRPDYIDKRKK